MRLFPTKSRIRSEVRRVMQDGMGPEMPFQSATIRVVSAVRLQMEGEMVPVI